MTSTKGRLRRLSLIAVGASALAATLGVGALGSLDGAEHRALDARFQVRGAQSTDELAVVAIDEHTLSQRDVTWPMRRGRHAEMLDLLREAGAKRIVYDVQFTEPSSHPRDDLQLFDAVAAAPGTVLATGESDARGRTRVLGGDDQLKSIGAFAADSTFPADSGGVIRRYSHEQNSLMSLATRTAATVGRAPGANEFQSDGQALIDFRGPARTIPTYSFADVASGKVNPATFRDRIVVVGATAPVLQDVHPTSAAGPRMMPGPEIQANAIWTAVHGNPLRALPDWAGLLIAGLLGGAAIALVVRFGPLRAVALTVLGLVAYVAVAVFAFSQGLVLPVAVPMLAVFAALASTALAHTAGELIIRAQLARYSARLEEEVKARTAELVDSQLEIVLRLAQAAELRDDDTGEHIDRMSTMCGEVARELGWSAGSAELLRHASALHDVGKIGVPDAILLKPGKLTDEEFAVMRHHVVHGAELLTGSDAPVLQLAEVVARTHHERWDGAGYPNGLAGDEIPLAGRIAAVCDVFDALTHERPYKRAWTLEEACAEIERGRDAHFDGRVVDAFKAVVARQAQQAAAAPGVGETAPADPVAGGQPEDETRLAA